MIVISPARAAEIVGFEDNPFFAWDNAAAQATLGGSDPLTDGARENAVTGTTMDFFRPDVTATTATLSAQFASARSVPFAGLAAHNLASLGATVRIRRSSDGVAWTDAGAGPVTPSDNRPIGWRMASSGQDFSYWQVYVTGLTIGDPLRLGVFFLGDEVLVPQRFLGGFAPIITPTEVEGQSFSSEGGEFIGSTVRRRGSRISYAIDHVEDTFIRSAEWIGFQSAFNERRPAFSGWRPAEYPADLHYIWRDGDVIRPAYTGILRRMGFEFSARVHEAVL